MVSPPAPPAAQPDEEVEIFPLHAFDGGAFRRLGERSVGQSERARIAAQGGEALQQQSVRRAREQDRDEPIFQRPRGVHLVDIARRPGVLGVKIGPQRRAAHAGRRLDR